MDEGQPAARPTVTRETVSRKLSVGFTGTDERQEATRNDAGQVVAETLSHSVKAYLSQQISDPFVDVYKLAGDGGMEMVIAPPLNPWSLIQLPNKSDTLKACLHAMQQNVTGHGWDLLYVGPTGEETSDAAVAEKVRIRSLLDFPNGERSLAEDLKRGCLDYETIGYGFFEIGRDAAGRVQSIQQVPAHSVRKTVQDQTPVTVTLSATGPDGKKITRKFERRFRRYIQQRGADRVWFKEFGDPRTLDARTGRYATDGAPVAAGGAATELKEIMQYDPSSSYGTPSWISEMELVLGSADADRVNRNFFKENAIPAMALLVSGGLVRQETLDAIEDHFNSQRGVRSMNRVLVVEAEGDITAASDKGAVPAPRIELKPLGLDRQNDQLFGQYLASNGERIRASFRLPPIFIGSGQDYTYATAKTSYSVAEGQVFKPKRGVFQEFVNRDLLTSLGVQYWQFVLLGPEITDNAESLAAITTMHQIGALTPNVAIGMANRLFRLQIPPVTAAWGDVPFQFSNTLAQQGRLKGIGKVATPMVAGIAAAPGPHGAQNTSESVADPDQIRGEPGANADKPPAPPKVLASGKPDKAQKDSADLAASAAAMMACLARVQAAAEQLQAAA